MSSRKPDGPQRLARQVIYQNRWVNLYIDKVRFPNGQIIEQHHLVDFDTAAAIGLAENEQGEVLFVKVCRYTTGRTDWELPAGGMEAGETPLDTAQRETLEETGYQTRDHRLIYSYYPQDGISNKVYHIVHCRTAGCRRDFDHQEIDAVCWFGREEIRQMIAQRQIIAGSSLVALLLWLQGLPA